MSRFETGEFYHIYNRGVEKRSIFLKESDYRRFLFILNVFNDRNSTINTTRRINILEGSPTSLKPKAKEALVEIKEFCLMPNHFHLLIKQVVDEGISKFMQKIGVGYTHYFNERYKRSGVLFQGKTKSRHIHSNAYFMWLKRYIHLNPIDVVVPRIKNKSIKNTGDVIKKLTEYKWTSCDNYNIYADDLKGDLKEILDLEKKQKMEV